MMSWKNTERQEDEQARPLPPYTKVTAIQNFQPQHPHDLPFSHGDRLTILEPCNVIFWYLAEDAHGKRGVIPINFVKVDGSGGTKVWSKPPPPLPPSPSSSSTSSSTGHLVSATPDQRQRRLSPQTIPRSSMHPHVHRTSSAEGLDSSHPLTPPKPRLPSPPPMTSSSTPSTNDTTPPVVPPRHAPPIPFREPAGGRQIIPRSAGVTPGFKTGGKPPVPLPPSPKLQPLGKKLAPPPLQPKLGAKKFVPQQSNGPSSRHMTSKATPTKRPSYENKKPPMPNVWPLTSQPIPQGPPVDIDNRPPAPLPPEAFLPGSAGASAPPLSPSISPKGKYSTIQEFINKSGWFQPSVEAVLCRKAVIQLPVFQTMTTGVYLFKHRFIVNLQYVGKSHNVYKGLIQMFHRLFERPDSKLNPVELQLKYHSSDSEQWYVRLIAVQNPDRLDLEQAKMIARMRSVQPEGLNPKFEFSSREDWYEFAAWYKDHHSKLKTKEMGASGGFSPVLNKRK